MALVKLGVIGCGVHFQRSHIFPELNNETFRVVGVFDPSNDNVQKVEEALGYKVIRFESENELLKSNNINAVFIASPDRFHANSLTAAIMAGKHTFVEKPLAMSQEEMSRVEVVLKLAQEKGLVVSSCHPRRTDKLFQIVKELLDQLEEDEELGRILHINYDFSYHETPKDKLRQWKHERGLLEDHGNHEIDMVKFLLKGLFDPSIKSWTLTNEPDHFETVGIHDTGIYKGDNVVTFRFFGTRFLKNKVYPETLTIRFERGHLILETDTGTLSTVYQDDKSKSTVEVLGGTNYHDKFLGVTADFVKSVQAALDGKPDSHKSYLTIEDLIANNKFALESGDLEAEFLGGPRRSKD